MPWGGRTCRPAAPDSNRSRKWQEKVGNDGAKRALSSSHQCILSRKLKPSRIASQIT